jgi:hypothetical protein|uniref:Uncharacterized protein n=1 Tax=viral metagenome TaxID=1070528 RepID=A0A6C0JGU5_9ZZZZ
MKFCTLITTRSKSCSVKTLHTILRMNIRCIQHSHQNEILYVNDDPFEKVDMIMQCLKKCDRLLFIDFGVNVDDGSIKQMFEPLENTSVLVFPGVTEGIDWKLFRKKIEEGSTEPVSQMGLHFDTELAQKAQTDIYKVKKTKAKAWVMIPNNMSKKTKKIYAANMFDKLLEEGNKIYAFTASKLTMTYSHECISNILGAAGVKTN